MTSWSRSWYPDPPEYADPSPQEMSTINSNRTGNSYYSQGSNIRSSEASDAFLLPRRHVEYYDENSKVFAFTGIFWSFLCALAFIGAGIFVWWKAAPIVTQDGGAVGEDSYGDNSQGILIIKAGILTIADWIPKLALNAIVTICNYFTGNVHSTTLKWALIDKKKGGFNANLRFFTAVGGLMSMNGYIANFLHAASLIISQASVSVVLLPGPKGQTLIPSMAIIAIGASLLVQSLLACTAFFKVDVKTWSSSPLDVAIVAYNSGKIERQEHRCMRPAADAKTKEKRTDITAVEPVSSQPNAWETHNQVRYIVSAIWTMVFASFLWSYILFAFIASDYDHYYTHSGCKPQRFVPSSGNSTSSGQSTAESGPCLVQFTFNKWAGVENQLPNNAVIGLNLGLFIIFQGVLAAVLHCCELIVTMSRDEDVWRKATSRSGAKHVGNQLYNFMNWKSIAFLACNPVLHWIMGNSVVIHEGLTAMYPMQIIELTLGLIVIASLVTFLARKHPKGQQPSAFGHLQTLVNLIDEDSKRLFWGGKGRDDMNGGVRHAGTAPRRSDLESILPHEKYAGYSPRIEKSHASLGLGTLLRYSHYLSWDLV